MTKTDQRPQRTYVRCKGSGRKARKLMPFQTIDHCPVCLRLVWLTVAGYVSAHSIAIDPPDLKAIIR